MVGPAATFHFFLYLFSSHRPYLFFLSLFLSLSLIPGRRSAAGGRSGGKLLGRSGGDIPRASSRWQQLGGAARLVWGGGSAVR